MPLSGERVLSRDEPSILVLSRYERKGASSRYRMYQYLPFLHSCGWKTYVAPLLSDEYIDRLYSGSGKPWLEILSKYVERIRLARQARRFSIIWLQQELLPWIPDILEAQALPSDAPVVVDYDDATFHRYDQHRLSLVRAILGRKIDSVMLRSSVVVAGNEYLAERAILSGARQVVIIPTVIDDALYVPGRQNPESIVRIGWIGSPSTQQYLHTIIRPLQALCDGVTAKLVIIGAGRIDLPRVVFDVVPWTTENEVSEIGKCDIGIMPLPDTPWERGKCGFKLIQFMGCARPVVASPVGVNRSIINHGVSGYLASDDHEWIDVLRRLIADSGLRKRMGQEGRSIVESRYSLRQTSPVLEELLRTQCREW